jgi:hypothetical protein
MTSRPVAIDNFDEWCADPRALTFEEWMAEPADVASPLWLSMKDCRPGAMLMLPETMHFVSIPDCNRRQSK